MKKKKKMNSIWIWAIILGLTLAFIYLYIFNRGAGVYVSCDTKSILSIRKVPPPLMEMAQPKICEVNITVIDFNNNLICNSYIGIFSTERDIVECVNIESYKNQNVNVYAEFFDINKNLIGKDNKTLSVNP